MSSGQFTIGRSSECEFIVTNDPKCSRKHAQILCTFQFVEVISDSESNPVLVNGEPQNRARLKDGDKIQLGETEIQFNLSKRFEPAQVNLVRPQQGPVAKRGRAHPQRKKNSNSRIVIYFVLALAALWLFTPSGRKKKEIDLKTEQQIQADIDTATKLKDIADSAAVKRMDSSVNSRQAQENFVRGFRDYRKGQFERSVVSFQACLALMPDHVLCNRYQRLSQRKFDELIQYQMVLGRKYRDQNQFRACTSSFRNVMTMVKDVNSPAYREAKANYDACTSFVEGRF
jgi:pSer/pThr/pTyr-binding forkhead associated (FHA) protein